MTSLLDRLEAGEALTQGEFTALLRGRTPALAQALFGRAVRLRRRYYGDAVRSEERRGGKECGS